MMCMSSSGRGALEISGMNELEIEGQLLKLQYFSGLGCCDVSDEWAYNSKTRLPARGSEEAE